MRVIGYRATRIDWITQNPERCEVENLQGSETGFSKEMETG